MKHIKVVAAVIEHEGRFFSARRGYGEWKGWWEFPGGKIEPGESPEVALKREIHEELAADIRVGKKICTIEYDYPLFHLTMHCYACEMCNCDLNLLEHEDARWLSKQDFNDIKWLPADRLVLDFIR